MLVGQLRRTLIERVEQVAAERDEEVAAQVLTHARTILVALAGRPGDEEVSLQELTVGTQTAALIMGLHREYVRSLVRGGRLSATKTNGEFQIPLSAVADLMRTEADYRTARKVKTLPSEWWSVGNPTLEVKLTYEDMASLPELPPRES